MRDDRGAKRRFPWVSGFGEPGLLPERLAAVTRELDVLVRRRDRERELVRGVHATAVAIAAADLIPAPVLTQDRRTVVLRAHHDDRARRVRADLVD